LARQRLTRLGRLDGNEEGHLEPPPVAVDVRREPCVGSTPVLLRCGRSHGASRGGTLAAVAVLLATGTALATHFGQWEQPALHAKLALVGVAVVWHMRRPQRRFLEGLIFVASLAIVWLGLTLAH